MGVHGFILVLPQMSFGSSGFGWDIYLNLGFL